MADPNEDEWQSGPPPIADDGWQSGPPPVADEPPPADGERPPLRADLSVATIPERLRRSRRMSASLPSSPEDQMQRNRETVRKILEDETRYSVSPPSFLQWEAPPAHEPWAAAGAGAVQGATFDTADEIEAAVRAPFSDRSYREIRDERRARNRQLQSQDPGPYMGGKIAAATLENALIPGAAATIPARMALSTVQGAATGLGAADEMEDVPREMVGGGAAGFLGAGAGELLRGAGNRVGRLVAPLDDMADTWRTYVPGRPMDAFSDVGGAPAVGRRMRAEGIGDRLFSGPGEVAEDAAAAQARVRPVFDDIHAQADASGVPVSMSRRDAQRVAANLGTDLPEPTTRAQWSNVGTEAPIDPLSLSPPSDAAGQMRVRSGSTTSTPDMPRDLGGQQERAMDAVRDLAQDGGDPLLTGASRPRSTSFRGAHDLRQYIDRQLDSNARHTPERQEIRAAIARAMDTAANDLGPGQQQAWRGANATHEIAARAGGAANRAREGGVSHAGENIGRTLGTGAAIMALGGGAAGAAAGEAAGGRGAEGGMGGAAALGLAGLAMKGRGARMTEALARGASRAANVASMGLEAADPLASAAIQRSDAVRSAAQLGVANVSEYVRSVIERAMQEDEDPAVTGFKAAADPAWRQASVMENEQ